jgi:hypothetical protein
LPPVAKKLAGSAAGYDTSRNVGGAGNALLLLLLLLLILSLLEGVASMIALTLALSAVLSLRDGAIVRVAPRRSAAKRSKCSRTSSAGHTRTLPVLSTRLAKLLAPAPVLVCGASSASDSFAPTRRSSTRTTTVVPAKAPPDAPTPSLWWPWSLPMPLPLFPSLPPLLLPLLLLLLLLLLA